MKSETQDLDKAIFAIQQAAEAISKSDQVQTDKFSFKFAGLPKVWEAIKPLLKEHNVLAEAAVSITASGQDVLETTLTHVESGQFKTRTMRLVMSRQDPQGMGAAITYARRYQISCMLGLVTEEDDDAKSHKLATADQKRDWVQAYTVVAKQANPDAKPTYNEFGKFFVDIFGKGVNEVLAKESQAVLETIKALGE